MDFPIPPMPEAPPPGGRARDPLAVALGNASLLNAGYLMLGRRKLAAASGLVSLVLVILLATAARAVWFEVVVVLWWAALIAHGWSLAGGRTRRTTAPVADRRQRLIALCVTLPVLLVVGLLRFDASGIERSVADARHDGDCARAVTAQHRVWIGPRLADSPLTASGDTTVQACRRIAVAQGELTRGLTGDTGALKAGFDVLASVLTRYPGHEQVVESALDRFLGGLPAKDPCDTATVTDWLRARPASHNTLDRSDGIVPRTAPAALVGCGDSLMAADDWTKARTRYQQLLDQYPGFQLAAEARQGVTRATLAIELANVRDLLQGPTGTQPAYCSKPAKYSGAPPYRKGTNRALFYGNSYYTGKLPAGWRATDAAKAVLVVCAGDIENGTSVQTCPYEPESGEFSDFPTDVTFHKIAIPVKVYELRTGKLVAHTKVEINGSSCPAKVSYTSFDDIDTGPPSDMYVKPSLAEVRAGFRSLIVR